VTSDPGPAAPAGRGASAASLETTSRAPVHLGIDLAWGANGRTGLAAVDAAGALLDSTSVRTDEEIDAWLDAHPRPVVVGVDAPLIVPNATGRRDAERLLGQAYARFDAGAHPTNRSRPWMDPPRGLRLAERRGWSVDPEHPATADAPVCIEVYPHPGMVGLFRLGRVVAYKKGAFGDRRAGFGRLLALLESVDVLRLDASAAWASIRARFAAATRLVDLDVLEDEIDAVFCAHLAWLWAERREALTVYGDLAGGYLVAPPPPDHEPTPRGTAPVERPAVGVGPWEGEWPDDDRYDPELLAAGDARNVVDGYRYWRMEAIVADLDRRRHPFSVAIENWQHDLNIGSIVRTANAFLAETVHIVGRRRWNKRGAMVTDRYQHVVHHDDVAGLLVWARERGVPVVAVDNVERSVPVETFALPERCVLLFGQEGPGLTAEALAAADAVVAIRQFGSTRSINASAAAAIVMHEWIRRHDPA
jgi:predicted RNase H-like nuclease/tRNA(Leu) C34 or U34 (ribose-2'-O)-methylase TrmL